MAFAAGATAAAIALFVVGFFIKQGSAVGIATVVLYCLIAGERRHALLLGTTWLVTVVAGTVLLALAYPYYLLNTVIAVRTIHFDWSAPMFFFSIMIGGSVGLAIFASIALTRRRVTARLIICFLAVAMIHDCVSCLRWGSNAYYFLPTLAALTIVASSGIDLALQRMRAIRVAPQFVAGAALALLLSLGSILAPSTCSNRRWDRRALEILRGIDGPILTDTAELQLIDQRRNLQWIDLMVLTSMQHSGTFDDVALLDAIQRHRITAFALDQEGLDRSFRGRPLFWPRLRRAIAANYRPIPSVGPPYLMTPKEAR